MMENPIKAELELSSTLSSILWMPSPKLMSWLLLTQANQSRSHSHPASTTFYPLASPIPIFKMERKIRLTGTTISQFSKYRSYFRALNCPTPNFHFLCNGSTETATILNKAGAFFKLSVPRTLTLKGITFDSADSHSTCPEDSLDCDCSQRR